MSNNYCLLLYFFILVMPAFQSNAQRLHVVGEIEAAQTNCSGGTSVFSVYREDVGSSHIYMTKNDNIVYSNESFENMQHIFSFLCMRHAIVVVGTNSSYLGTSVLTVHNGVVELTNFTGHRAPARVHSSKNATIVDIYGDDRRGMDTTVTQHAAFTDVFSVDSVRPAMPLSLAAGYAPAGEKKEYILTARSLCEVAHGNSFDTIEAIAYTEDEQSGFITFTDPPVGAQEKYELPFVITNSICTDSAVYFLGKDESSQRVLKFFYDKKTKKYVLQPSSASEVGVSLWDDPVLLGVPSDSLVNKK